MQIETTEHGVVVLDYNDLTTGKDLSASIDKAFGYDGIGLLVVKNVPGFVEKRQALLPLAGQYAALPEAVKDRTTHKASNYSVGWSHGKEMLKEGVPDAFKGSYYCNPQHDVPTTDPTLIREFPESCLPNIWPGADFPALEPAFKALGCLMVDVGLLVAQQCDAHVRRVLGERFRVSMREHVAQSRIAKGRLLHYFPIKTESGERSRDSWCAWHNDHSSLTALCPAMFVKEGEHATEVANPDPQAGLWVRTRANKEMRVVFPRDFLAFQIGETSQILSGGVLRATPHAVQAVRWPESATVGRNTFAVFMEPNFDVVMELPEGRTEQDAAVERFRKGMSFGDFSKVTIAGYYAKN